MSTYTVPPSVIPDLMTRLANTLTIHEGDREFGAAVEDCIARLTDLYAARLADRKHERTKTE